MENPKKSFLNSITHTHLRRKQIATVVLQLSGLLTVMYTSLFTGFYLSASCYLHSPVTASVTVTCKSIVSCSLLTHSVDKCLSLGHENDWTV